MTSKSVKKESSFLGDEGNSLIQQNRHKSTNELEQLKSTLMENEHDMRYATERSNKIDLALILFIISITTFIAALILISIL